MLHSGSRGIGNAIGTHFIELARRDMEQWMINLPDRDLAYFPEGTQHFDDYVEAVEWAQNFAKLNREVMMQNVIAAVRRVIPKPFESHVEAVNCHHNYVNREHHFGKDILVTRKGAVSARKGELGIIPAAWVRVRISCAASVTRIAFIAVATARAGRCRGPKLVSALRWRITVRRRRVSSAGRMWM
jgi:RNA-splicing ligase RtcB